MKIIISISLFLVAITAILLLVPFKTELGSYARINANERSVIDATFTATTGTLISVADFNLIGITITNVSASGTVKFPCSMSDTAPNLSAVASASNRYAYASVVDLESGSTIPGNTGLVFVNSSTIRHVAIQNSVFKHCTALFTPSTGSVGSTTVKMMPTNNQ